MISNAQERCCALRRPVLGLRSPHTTFDEGRVAIANGRMRSLKLLHHFSPFVWGYLGCNSEWPYEVTETHHRAHHRGAGYPVAIANGRMRSLKPRLATIMRTQRIGCNSEWPYEVTETRSCLPIEASRAKLQ